MFSGRQAGVLGLIVLLHVGFFYALQAGLLRQASQLVQEEVIARLILPEPPPVVEEPPPPPPPPPKVVPTPPPPPPTPRETVKPIDAPPPPTAITLPPTPVEPPPKPAEPAPVVVAPGPPDPAPPPREVAPPPPPPPPQPLVRSIGDAGIEYVRPPNASYPPISMRLRETGELTLRVLVNEAGKVDKVEVQKASGYPRLDNAAREAAARAVFKPFMDGGRAVPVWVLVPFSFKLDS